MSNIESYWDLSPAKRAALTREEVEDYASVELMLAGIVRPKPLVLLDETMPSMQTSVYYGITVSGRYGENQNLDVVFDTAEDAEQFLHSAPKLHVREYGEAQHVRDLLEPKIAIVDLPCELEVAAHKSSIDRARAAKGANEAARKRYDDDLKKIDKALKGLWDDYTDQVRLAARLQEVRNTYDAYLVMAKNDAESATAFLRKAFPPEHWNCRSGVVDVVFEALAGYQVGQESAR